MGASTKWGEAIRSTLGVNMPVDYISVSLPSLPHWAGTWGPFRAICLAHPQPRDRIAGPRPRDCPCLRYYREKMCLDQ